MNREQIVTALHDLLVGQKNLPVDPAAITPDTRLDQLGFDSISILDFMYDVEAKFDVQTEISDLVKMDRVDDLIVYLERKTAE